MISDVEIKNVWDISDKKPRMKILLIMVGLPATGKTTLATKVAKMYGFKILRTDLLRKEKYSEKELFDKIIAGNMESRIDIYHNMFIKATNILNQELSIRKDCNDKTINLFNSINKKDGIFGVILDATFVKQDLREQAALIADQSNSQLIIMQTICKDNIAVHRIKQRNKEKYVSNALDPQVYYDNKELFDKIDLQSIKKKYPSLRGALYKVKTDLELTNSINIIEQIVF